MGAPEAADFLVHDKCLKSHHMVRRNCFPWNQVEFTARLAPPNTGLPFYPYLCKCTHQIAFF